MGFLANRAPAQASATPTDSPRERVQGRYQDLRSNDQNGRLQKGEYLVEVVKTGLAGEKHDWFNLDIKILSASDGASNPVGSLATVQIAHNSKKSEAMGRQKVMRLAVVASGHETDAAFREEMGPTWEDLIDRIYGDEFEDKVFGPNPLAGAKMRIAAVGSGKFAENGSEFHNYSFTVHSE